MKAARDLISDRVVVVDPEQRLRDVAVPIEAKGALYCAVVEKTGAFVGLVRLSEVGSKSSERIFADLLSPKAPLDVLETMEADLVIKLLRAQGRDELVVLSVGRKYVGLATRESVFEWWARQWR
jgi:predicted transcriptional regulator